MPKAPIGQHWRTKVQEGTYTSPCNGVKKWKEEFEALFKATYGESQEGQMMPWAKRQVLVFGGNPYYKTGYTGRYLYVKLKALEKMGKIKLHTHEDPKEGFFGILKIEVPPDAIEIFDGAPMPSREHVHAKYSQDKKERTKAWKTVDKSWRTFGMLEKRRSEDGVLEFTFDKAVAEAVSRRHKNRGRKTVKVEEAESESESEMDMDVEEAQPEKAAAAAAAAADQPFAALQMLASISTKT